MQSVGTVPTIKDRALQGVVKTALEPEWEALFEPNSHGFRPGRACQDAVWTIKNSIMGKPKYVLDADITQCFDRINHLALLQKLGYTGKIRQQIKSWLKSGVIDQKVFTATSEGTPQGGVLSPLLASVALHGMEIMLMEAVKTFDIRRLNNPKHQMSWQRKVSSLTFIRYADDFLVIHKDLNVVNRCRELISEWLRGMGLELKPSKTRITHTLFAELSEDEKAGFDFLGYHIQQFPVGKYRSAKHPSSQKPLGFKTLIYPSKEACKKHQRDIKHIIKKHKSSSQARLIKELNPVIRGWTKYYSFSDASTTGELARQDHLTFQKLRAWARYRTGKSLKKNKQRYWTKINKRDWVFATRAGNTNPLRLLTHTEFGSSSTKYVKVKGEESPFNGKLVYWSTRMGKSPHMPTRKAILLKSQRGICPWCCLRFREGDILEEDHILSLALGGKDEFKNLQLLHGHCHDEKTALDMKYIRGKETNKYYDDFSKELNKYDWYWKDDILYISSKGQRCSMTR